MQFGYYSNAVLVKLVIEAEFHGKPLITELENLEVT